MDVEKLEGRKTSRAHWDESWKHSVRPRLPSRLNVGVLNITRLLQKHVRRGDRYLEIGCAPGKFLAWASAVLGADASGLDYSESGIKQCRALLSALQLPVKVYHQDFFEHTLPLDHFEVVSSFGLIEHFEDPRDVISRHLNLVRPGGLALIAVPNYGGLYGRIQKRVDPDNLAIHNLNIMKPDALAALGRLPGAASSHARYYGSVSPWLVTWRRLFPEPISTALVLGLNGFGLLQPFSIASLAPLLVLEIRKERK